MKLPMELGNEVILHSHLFHSSAMKCIFLNPNKTVNHQLISLEGNKCDAPAIIFFLTNLNILVMLKVKI